jgi:ribose 5-phosphate isomerase A
MQMFPGNQGQVWIIKSKCHIRNTLKKLFLRFEAVVRSLRTEIYLREYRDMDKKRIAGEKAADYVKEGMILGLGTGSTAYYAMNAIGRLVKEGMLLRAVPTSRTTELQARSLGIPLLSIDEVERIDLIIDGVDEIDRNFNAIKGGGGALYREKVVASLAEEVIWIMDDSKLVDAIGKFPLPVEVAQYGYRQAMGRMERYGLHPALRMQNQSPYITDNGNYIIDLHLDAPMNIEYVCNCLSSVVGVLEHGLFIKICKRILVGCADGVKVIECH